VTIKAETSFSLKDDLFNAATVAELGAGLAGARKGFPRKRFEAAVLGRFGELELKARIDWIVTQLGEFLPANYPEALKILADALPPPLDPTRTDDDFGRFIWVAPGEYAARHGVSRRHLTRSLAFLRETTKRFSAENAIRPFLREFTDETMAFVRRCARDRNYHVRRLASEGIRPLLPWSERVALDGKAIVAILDLLHSDRTRYVTRSVANNLNDLSKQDPALVLKTLKRWQRERRQEAGELEWMTRHALRTLTKANDLEALKLLGYPTRPRVKLEALAMPERVAVGESLESRLELRSNAQQKLLITLRVHFLKANGRHSPKVFQVAKAEFGKGELAILKKKVVFRPMTTRTLYPGTHHLEVLANGKVLAGRSFELDGQQPARQRI
jgi:3-methyladenine DNA glycosylase AlkC